MRMNQRIFLANKRIDGMMTTRPSEKNYTSYETSVQFEGYINILWENEEYAEKKKIYSNYDKEGVKWFSILDHTEINSRIMFNGRNLEELRNEIERQGHEVLN